jgi:hypothetical protein
MKMSQEKENKGRTRGRQRNGRGRNLSTGSIRIEKRGEEHCGHESEGSEGYEGGEETIFSRFRRK